jgi:hypothetical protein
MPVEARCPQYGGPTTCRLGWEALWPSRLSVPGVGSQMVHALHSVCVSPCTGASTRDLALHGGEPLHRETRSRPVAEPPSALRLLRCPCILGHGVPKRFPARQACSPTVVRLAAVGDPGGSPVTLLRVVWRVAGAQVHTLSRHPISPVLGTLWQIPSIPSSPRRTPAAAAAVPGGWIDLTREGFCYAYIVGIFSFSVVPQSLVN